MDTGHVYQYERTQVDIILYLFWSIKYIHIVLRRLGRNVHFRNMCTQTNIYIYICKLDQIVIYYLCEFTRSVKTSGRNVHYRNMCTQIYVNWIKL